MVVLEEHVPGRNRMDGGYFYEFKANERRERDVLLCLSCLPLGVKLIQALFKRDPAF